MYDVAVVKYEKPFESLRKAVDLVRGLEGIAPHSNVVIKPNYVMWLEGMDFPKYGVLTTARLIEDIVVLLKEHGIRNISIVEGPTETGTSLYHLAVKGMGIDLLAQRHGVKLIDVLEGSFTRVTAGDVSLSVSKDVLAADHIINMPVLKTHSQAMVSLGIKNLKGILSVASRKRCHSPDQLADLNYHLARLTDMISPSLTIIDGIYTLERGPTVFGNAHRSDIILASKDLISADKVGATLLGIAPQTVPHLTMASKNKGRPVDLSDVRITGDIDLATASKHHEWKNRWNESGDLPALLEMAGVKGITFRSTDTTLCTYCAGFIRRYVQMGLMLAKNRNVPFDDIEILQGKLRDPEGGHRHTLLVGQCQVKRNSHNRQISHCVKIGGCPPREEDFYRAYDELGIELPGDFMGEVQKVGGAFLMANYVGKPEFQE
ncbi:MAG TPA: DUF362 domain-containing protein, partial [Dehalococcoidia bacterium]|nr:DUF362 domain-containing protein [Dehalococcoidia bacterium]